MDNLATKEAAMGTRQLSVADIESILRSEDLTQLIGVEETADFEFREHSYMTTLHNQAGYKSKLELVRDVTAIANSGGGLICLGLKPKQKETEKKEYVESVLGIKKEHAQIQSWLDTLADMVVPRFSPNNIEYGSVNVEEDNQVFWMRIKDADESGSFPFILAKDQWEQSAKQGVKGMVFGYYYRDGAENVWMSPEKMQEYIARGIAADQGGSTPSGYEVFQAQLQGMGSKLDAFISSVQKGNKDDADQAVERRKNDLLKYASSKLGGDSGYFYIYASPTKAATIPNFWKQSKGDVHIALSDPPRLRDTGWDLSVARSEYPTAHDDAWQIMNGDRKLTLVTQRGEMFTAGAIQDFLDWATNVSNKEIKPINNMALVEYIDVFFHFFYIGRVNFELEQDFVVKFGFVVPDHLQYELHRPSLDGTVMDRKAGKLSQRREWTITVPMNDQRYPKHIAAEVMENIYSSGFGLTERQFAYLQEGDGGLSEVDESYFVRQK